MAKACVDLKCKKCGMTFRFEKDCGSRADANRTEQWALDGGVDICPDCYRATKAPANGFSEARMHYSDYKFAYSKYETVKDSYDAETKTIAVIVPDKCIVRAISTEEARTIYALAELENVQVEKAAGCVIIKGWIEKTITNTMKIIETTDDAEKKARKQKELVLLNKLKEFSEQA